MKLVVDSNIVFAALLRDSTTRSLLIDPPADLIAPETMLSEIRRHRDEIVERSGLSGDEFDLLLTLVTEDIEVVPREAYDDAMIVARERIGDRDLGDVPFLALSLAVDADGIWTENVADFEEAGVEVWSTERVVTLNSTA